MQTLNEVIFGAPYTQTPWEADALHYLKEFQSLSKMWNDRLDKEQENPPLTWEELKKMEGKPVWIEMTRPGYLPWSGWEVIDHDGVSEKFMSTYRDDYAREQQGKTWQVYRKERTNEG